jgi:acetyl esterase/lipase
MFFHMLMLEKQYKIWGKMVPGIHEIDLSWVKRFKQNRGFANYEEIPSLSIYFSKICDPNVKTPLIIVFPGGGYSGRAPHEGEPIAKWINSLGIHAAVMNYRVSPYHHPYPLLDGLRAVQYIRYLADDKIQHNNKIQIRIDTNKVGILGFSAGGHLASSVGVHWDFDHKCLKQQDDPINSYSTKPNLLILCYPVISFTKFAHQGCIRNYLGKYSDPKLLKYFSNEEHININTPPTFLWHTIEDQGVPVKHSELFIEKLKEKGIESELHTFPHGRHGLGLAEGVPEVETWPIKCSNWLQKIGWISKN